MDTQNRTHHRLRRLAIVALAALALIACDDDADGVETEPTFCILETDFLDCP